MILISIIFAISLFLFIFGFFLRKTEMKWIRWALFIQLPVFFLILCGFLLWIYESFIPLNPNPINLTDKNLAFQRQNCSNSSTSFTSIESTLDQFISLSKQENYWCTGVWNLNLNEKNKLFYIEKDNLKEQKNCGFYIFDGSFIENKNMYYISRKKENMSLYICRKRHEKWIGRELSDNEIIAYESIFKYPLKNRKFKYPPGKNFLNIESLTGKQF